MLTFDLKQDLISRAVSSRAGVGLAGTKNGVNKVFTLPEGLLAGSEVIYWNGQWQMRDDDYTISGVTITFTAGHPAPASTDSLPGLYAELMWQ